MLALSLLAAAAFAGTPVAPVNRDRKNVALKGHDPVAYFTEGRPEKGSPSWSLEWMGATWYFVTERSRDLFRGNPGRYAPQFGGYCAWAVSHGYTADADPRAWKIIDGKLYLNYSNEVQQKWEQDPRKYIDDGNRNWPSLHR